MAKSQTRVRTGVDEILNGGLIPHRLYLVEGDPGAGKTTLATHFLMKGRRKGEPRLYIALSETKEELIAGAASHGWDSSGIEILELTPRESDLLVDNQRDLISAGISR